MNYKKALEVIQQAVINVRVAGNTKSKAAEALDYLRSLEPHKRDVVIASKAEDIMYDSDQYTEELSSDTYIKGWNDGLGELLEWMHYELSPPAEDTQPQEGEEDNYSPPIHMTEGTLMQYDPNTKIATIQNCDCETCKAIDEHLHDLWEAERNAKSEAYAAVLAIVDEMIDADKGMPGEDAHVDGRLEAMKELKTRINALDNENK